jgi:hypothetical protein
MQNMRFTAISTAFAPRRYRSIPHHRAWCQANNIEGTVIGPGQMGGRHRGEGGPLTGKEYRATLRAAGVA